MHLKIRLVWVAFIIGLLIIGCGGGGGGGSTTTGTNGTTDGGSSSGATNLQLSANSLGTSFDLNNVLVGDTVTLKVFGRDSLSRTVEVPASGWTTTAPSSVATMSSAGVLTANGPTAGLRYTVSAIANGTVVTGTLRVQSSVPTVTGRIRNVNDTGIGGVTLKFYTSSGTQVGTATSGLNGTFRAALPTTARQFTLDIEAADPIIGSSTIYYRQFSFDSKVFLNGESSCYAPLPVLPANTNTALATDLFIPARNGGPPPPPTGCVG